MHPGIAFAVLAAFGFATVSIVSLTWFAQRALAMLLVSPPHNRSAFDYIIVGSGTAGSVVAGRLAEGGHGVLLIEAGGPAHFLQGIPAFVSSFAGSLYDWNYEQVRKERLGGIYKNKTARYPRGKVLGGSSNLNWLHYFRGHSKDFDEWRGLGNPGWGWKDVEPHFKSAEKYNGNDADDIYGTEGKYAIEKVGFKYEVDGYVADALRELGYKFGDVNGKEADGGFWETNVASTRNGWRDGSFASFVEPLVGKAKIQVLTYALASKVLLERGEATGVGVERFGQNLAYFARKEVVLSAGSIGSPQILMLSGIGPRVEVEKHGILLQRDLPVGKNLQDHCKAMVTFDVAEAAATTDKEVTQNSFVKMNPLNYFDYFIRGQGVLAHNNLGIHGVFHTPLAKPEDRPDMMLIMLPFHHGVDYGQGFMDGMNWNETWFESRFGGDRLGGRGITLFPKLLRPKSRGSVTLRSADPKDPPIIDTNYLDHPDDLDRIVEGVKFIKSLEGTDSFKRHGITMMPPESLLCGDHEPYSAQYYRCYVSNYIQTVYHPVGTCAMGPEGHQDAVIDHRMRVHGISRLRVVDASIMPRLVGANTNAAVLMIGEKGASMIHEDSSKLPPRNTPGLTGGQKDEL